MIRVLLIALGVGPAPPGGSACSRTVPEIDAILTRLEKKGDEIKDLRCQLLYRVDDKINLDELTKYGVILFKRGRPHDVFLIHFHKLVQDDVPTKKKEWYLFKNRWLWEAKERSATIIKREVVAKGEKVDLFDLETAPFPVPFGQKKDNILKNFDVTLAPPAEGDPEDTDHLICIPKPGTELARDYSKLEFHVSRKTSLPVRIVTTEVSDKKVIRVTTAVFTKVEIDSGLTDKDFAAPAEWNKYTVIEEPLAKPQPPPGE